jgi:formylglycine-generating enzyme required for sulfatase activity
VKLEMIWCPPGSYMRGSPDFGSKHWDRPQHRVTLTKGFWIGKYEVTQEQWQQVMGTNPSHFKNQSNPVENVSWEDCQRFVQTLNSRISGGGFRLPTSAEWEYACRAGTSTSFHYGDDLDASMANFNGELPYGNGIKGEYRGKTLPVGSFRPNAWGLYDMHGNASEWCEDGYVEYTLDSVTDPTGPSTGSSSRAIRGGGWNSSARECTSFQRTWKAQGEPIIGASGLRLMRMIVP